MSRGDELEDLAGELSRAAEAARRLGLPTATYLLSMALLEVRQAAAADRDRDDDGAA